MTQATDLIKNAASRSQSPEAKTQKAKKKRIQQSEKTRLTLNDGGSGPSVLKAGGGALAVGGAAYGASKLFGGDKN